MKKLNIILLTLSIALSLSSCKVIKTKYKYPQGTFVDSRDGEVYKTMQVGKYIWMTENLRYNAKGSWENPNNPSKKYGRLYNYATLMNGTDTLRANNGRPKKVQGLCPEGWFVPSFEAYHELYIILDLHSNTNFFKGNFLKQFLSKEGWTKAKPGNNRLGFNLLPAGTYRNLKGDQKIGVGLGAYTFFWYYDRHSRSYRNASEGVDAFVFSRKIGILFEELPTVTLPASLGLSCRCITEAKEGAASNTNYKTIQDSRDGEVYKTVRIGRQTWLAENMRYNVPGSKLNPANPSKSYGRLYTWTEAKKACPSGWHLPTDKEWRKLRRHINFWYRGKDKLLALKSTIGWSYNEFYELDEFYYSDEYGLELNNGFNTSGFNAYPAGYYDDANFDDLGYITFFWSSVPKSKNQAWGKYFDLNMSERDMMDGDDQKDLRFSCRCVKD